MSARTSPSSIAVPSNFSISPTCGFAFEDARVQEFHVEYTPHPALKRLKFNENGRKKE